MNKPLGSPVALRRWCHALPGAILAAGDRVAWTRLAAHAAKNTAHDAHAALAWILAAYVTRRHSDRAAWQTHDLPHAKAFAQTLIAAPAGEVRMSDAGLLVRSAGDQPVTVNALWYFTLAMLADELAAAADPQASHFARLAGRFRRSFAKWTGDAPDELPHADLLLVTLPYSPIARTRQRQIADQPLAAPVSPTDPAALLARLWRIEASAVLGKPVAAAAVEELLSAAPFPPSFTAAAAVALLAASAATPGQLVQAEAIRIRRRFATPPV